MPSTKKIFSKVKIKALPSAQLKEKLKFQATKIISKEMKIIKNLLIRKLIRKLQEERESSNSDENTENLLLALKKVDHTAIGKAITGSMSILSVNNTDQETCAAQIEAHVLQYFKSHRRTKEVIESLEKKINSSIQKNNSLRSKEQKALAKKQKLSNMIMKRRLDVVRYYFFPLRIHLLIILNNKNSERADYSSVLGFTGRWSQSGGGKK